MKAEKLYPIISKWEEHSAIYFEAENGDGVLMPAKPRK